MTLVGVSLFFAAITATWANTPALLAEAVAPVEASLQACMTKPHRIGLVAARGKDGSTQVAMPVYGVGGRGHTPEERCLMKVAATIALPPLPVSVERLGFAFPLDATDQAWDGWRDLTATHVDPTAFAGCDRKRRTVRIVLHRFAYLPAWQFSGASAAVKSCVTRGLKKLSFPALPAAMGEIHFAVSL